MTFRLLRPLKISWRIDLHIPSLSKRSGNSDRFYIPNYWLWLSWRKPSMAHLSRTSLVDRLPAAKYSIACSRSIYSPSQNLIKHFSNKNLRAKFISARLTPTSWSDNNEVVRRQKFHRVIDDVSWVEDQEIRLLNEVLQEIVLRSKQLQLNIQGEDYQNISQLHLPRLFVWNVSGEKI